MLSREKNELHPSVLWCINRLSEWMQLIPKTGQVCDVSEDILDHIFDGIE